MASNRSMNQKVVRVFAILALIAGVAALAIGCMGFFGGADIVAQTGGDTVETVGNTTATTTQLMRLGSVLVIVMGAFTLVEGVLGIRASNDATKAMPYLVLSCVTFAMALVNVFTSGFAYANLSAALINGFNVWSAFKVRQEGRQQ